MSHVGVNEAPGGVVACYASEHCLPRVIRFGTRGVKFLACATHGLHHLLLLVQQRRWVGAPLAVAACRLPLAAP